MVKPIINNLVDFLMAISLIVTVIAIFTRSRLHETAGAIFIILVILHLLLHFKYIVGSIKRMFVKS